MEISDIYVHDGKILRVVEDMEQDKLKMAVLLPSSQRAMSWFLDFWFLKMFMVTKFLRGGLRVVQ